VIRFAQLAARKRPPGGNAVWTGLRRAGGGLAYRPVTRPSEHLSGVT